MFGLSSWREIMPNAGDAFYYRWVIGCSDCVVLREKCGFRGSGGAAWAGCKVWAEGSFSWNALS